MNLSIEPIEGKREIIRKYDALPKMSIDDDVERLLVEPLVLVALQLLDLVQAAALLDYLTYLDFTDSRLCKLLGCEEDVVHSVQHDGHGLLVLGGHEVAEGAQHASLMN